MMLPIYSTLTTDATRLYAAWLKVLQRNKRGGIDGKSIDDFAPKAEATLEKIRAELQNKTYAPEPYLSVSIAKKDGGTRGLGMLTVRDKIVQQALTDLLQPAIEPRLNDASFAYRPRRGVPQAVQRITGRMANGKWQVANAELNENGNAEQPKTEQIILNACRYALRGDVKAFFDNVPHSLLEKQLRFFIKDNDLVQLALLCMGMGKVDKTGHWVDVQRVSAPVENPPAERRGTFGLPQGGILSPLLSNLYLHQLDVFVQYTLKIPQGGYTRYADDFILLTKERNQAEAFAKRISTFLAEKLQLALGTCEIHAVKDGFTFLGMQFDTEGARLAPQKLQEITDTIHKSLYIDRNTQQLCTYFHSNLEKIQRYQAPVLNEAQKTTIDEHICSTVRNFINKNAAADTANNAVANNAVKNTPDWKAFLEKTPFMTKTYRENKQKWVAGEIEISKLRMTNGTLQMANGKLNMENDQSVRKANSRVPSNTSEKANENEKTGIPFTKKIPPKTQAEPVPPKTRAEAQPPKALPQIIEIDRKKIIADKRREYEKRESAMLELVVAHAGASLGVQKGKVTVRINGQDALQHLPTANIRCITIVTHYGSLSLAFLQHCTDKKITLIIHDREGKPQTLFQHTTMLENKTWLAQNAAATNLIGANIAKTIATAKINNQINLLKYFAKSRGNARIVGDVDTDNTDNNTINDIETIAKMEKAITLINDLAVKTPMEKLRLQIMGHEGVAAQLYWQAFRTLLGDKANFTNRQHQGARDLVNNMLNYGYGILYGRTWSAVLAAGLHPSVSFLHTPRTNEPTLTFDLIEPFRAPIVDRAVIALLTKGEPMKTTPDGRLDDDTRRRLVEKVLERLNAFETFRGERMRISDIMRLQAVHLAAFLQKEKTSFKPYSMKW